MANKSRTGLKSSGVLFSVFLLPPIYQNVHPYIDAGTGGLIIQILIASFAAGLFLLKVFWGKVRAFGGKARAFGGKQLSRIKRGNR